MCVLLNALNLHADIIAINAHDSAAPHWDFSVAAVPGELGRQRGGFLVFLVIFDD